MDVEEENGNGMENIKHVVVVMFENRSFDHLLGWLYRPHNGNVVTRPAGESGDVAVNLTVVPPDNDVPFRGLAFGATGVEGDFLVSRDHACVDIDGTSRVPARVMVDGKVNTAADEMEALRKHVNTKEAQGMAAPHVLRKWIDYATWPRCDPGEEFEHIRKQIYNSDAVDWSTTPLMDGFVVDFASLVGKKGYKAEGGRLIMESIPPAMLPVFSSLAREYAVCDDWFASVPSQTWCNRLFALYGSSLNFVNNRPMFKHAEHIERFAPLPFFAHLKSFLGNTPLTEGEPVGENNVPFNFRVYTHAKELDTMSSLVGHFADPTEYVLFDKLKEDAAHDNLPSFAWIEPRYIPDFVEGTFLFHNDMHPAEINEKLGLHPPTIWEAEKLLLDIYEALFVSGSAKDETLLVVLFDEHGGCYDHVPPPLVRPPTGPAWRDQKDFVFQRAGVRIPAIFVSPLIKKNTVLRHAEGSVCFDHTSLMRSVFERFGLPEDPVLPLTLRQKTSSSFWHVLNGGSPRMDAKSVFEKINKQLENLRTFHKKVFSLPENWKAVRPQLVGPIVSTLRWRLKHAFVATGFAGSFIVGDRLRQLAGMPKNALNALKGDEPDSAESSNVDEFDIELTDILWAEFLDNRDEDGIAQHIINNM